MSNKVDGNRKVLFVIGTDWASGYYRMSQAAIKLRNLGFNNVEMVDFRSLDVINLVAHKQVFTGDITKPATERIDLRQFHTIIFQLVWVKEILSIIKNLKGNVKTALELDDDYFSLPSGNQAYYTFHPKYDIVYKNGKKFVRKYDYKVNDRMDVLKETLRTVDMIQVSTPELAETYKNFNSNIVVLQNSVDNSLYDKPYADNDSPVVGWFGTNTHKDDLQQIVGCIPYQTPILLAGDSRLDEDIFKKYPNVKCTGAYSLEELPDIISKIDIGIVPLKDIKFNAGKSELKGIEFGAGNVPIVASDVAPYRRYVKHEKNGFLVKKNKTKFWIRHINKLLNDRELRISMGKENKQTALNRDISKYITEWIECYFT